MKTKNDELLSVGMGVIDLDYQELKMIVGGADPAEGSYAAGYAIGRWFYEMYHIWHYGLTHLADR